MACRRFLCLLFLAVLVLAHNVAWADCPDGFVEIDGSCYYFSEEKKDFEGATWDCAIMGGTLATFDDCEIKDTVVNEPKNEEPCTYWTNPYTECLDSYSPTTDENKYICSVPISTACGFVCRGKCESYLRAEFPGFKCSGNFVWRINTPNPTTCSCTADTAVANENCCAPIDDHSCELTCGGWCMYPIPGESNGGCPGLQRNWVDCPCREEMFCCVVPPPGGN